MNPNIYLSPEELETIERYFLNEMPQNEVIRFEEKLNTDMDFKDKVYAYRLMTVGIQETHLAGKLQEYHSQVSPAADTAKVIKARWPFTKILLVAASVLCVVALGVWLLTGIPGANEKLYSSYYKPDPGLITAMSATDDYEFDHAMISYKTGKYDAAINEWKQLLKQNPASDTLNYFIGSAYLAKDEPTLAIQYFKKVAERPGSYFLSDSYWYSGLALLKQGKAAEAKGFLNKTDHEGKQELLSKLP